MKKFKVHIARTYTERYAVEVKASTLERARTKAIDENEDFGFDWNNVECDSVEVMGIDDARGRELFSRPRQSCIPLKTRTMNHQSPLSFVIWSAFP